MLVWLSHAIMGLLYASEAWIMSIFGWVWLTTQEIWGFSLLSAYIYYGMLLLSTCNLVLVGCFPDMRALRSAYFSAVVVLLVTSAACIFETVESVPAVGSTPFKLSGLNGTNCSLHRMNRIFFFSDAPLYLAQGGVILGFLVVHLFIAAAGMTSGGEGEQRSVWPGSAWGLALMAMVAFRYFVVFDGTAKGLSAWPPSTGMIKQFRYLYLFSEPLWEINSGFLVFFEGSLVLLALEGFPMPSLGQRKFVRYFVVGFTPVFVAGACVALSFRGMLTIPALISLLLAVPPAVAGAIEAAQAKAPKPTAPAAQPSAPPEHLMSRSVYNRPDARTRRQYIPVPVEMIGEKSKGV